MAYKHFPATGKTAGIRPKKRLGQNFLVNEAIVIKIIEAADLSADDLVIEVGAGYGILTGELVKKAKAVVAVEIDIRLCHILKEKLAAFNNLTVVNRDILKTGVQELLEGTENEKQAAAYKVVANIPYYITSPIISHFLTGPLKPQLMILMVQKEVGEAIAARSGKRSLLGVIIEYYGDVEIVGKVARQNFKPVPKVDSLILKIELHDRPLVEVEKEKDFLDFIAAGFTAPRKQLHNSLSMGLGIESAGVRQLMAQAGLDTSRRAQSLSIEEWARLYERVRQGGSEGAGEELWEYD